MSEQSSAILLAPGIYGQMMDENGTVHELTPEWYREHGYRVTDVGDGYVMVQAWDEAWAKTGLS